MTFSISASSPPTRRAPVHYPGLGPAVRLAAGQGGVITYRQAMAAGLTRGQLRQLVHSGRWSHPVRGAFIVPAAIVPAAIVPAASTPAASVPGGSQPAGSALVASVPAGSVPAGSVAAGGVPAATVEAAGPAARGPRQAPGADPCAGLMPVATAAMRVAPCPPPGPGATASTVGMLTGGGVGAFSPAFPSPIWARARAALVGRPRAVVCEITAARLHGFPVAVPESGEEPVHLLLPARLTRAQPRGVRLHFRDLPADQVVELAGIPVTSPERTLADLVLAAQSRDSAVAVMDHALHRGLVRRLDGARAAAVGRRGFRATASWWSMADGRAESPLETRLRLLLTRHGLAPAELQWPVRDGTGQLVARLDLAWPAQRLDVEADTFTSTSPPGAVHRDHQRGNILAALRWAVLRFSAADVDGHPERVVSAVARVLAMREAEAAEGLRAS